MNSHMVPPESPPDPSSPLEAPTSLGDRVVAPSVVVGGGGVVVVVVGSGVVVSSGVVVASVVLRTLRKHV